MDNTLGVILVVGLVVGLLVLKMLLRKGVNAVAKTVNQKVLYKSEYEEGQQLVNTPLTFETTASVSDIMKALKIHVSTVETVPALTAAYYQTSIGNDHISYAYGSKMWGFFEAKVKFVNRDGKTGVIFLILGYKEKDGMITGQEAIKKLRKQVKAAIMDADANAIDNDQNNDKTWMCDCGTQNEMDAEFCENCGSSNPNRSEPIFIEDNKLKDYVVDDNLGANENTLVVENNNIHLINTWICNCGTENDPHAEFCENCGSSKPISSAPDVIDEKINADYAIGDKMPATTSRLFIDSKNLTSIDKWICSCGTDNDTEAEFCENCGSSSIVSNDNLEFETSEFVSNVSHMEYSNNDELPENDSTICLSSPSIGESDRPKFCGNCGEELETDALFCHNCSAPIAFDDEIKESFNVESSDQIDEIILVKEAKKTHQWWRKKWLVITILSSVIVIGLGIGAYFYFTYQPLKIAHKTIEAGNNIDPKSLVMLEEKDKDKYTYTVSENNINANVPGDYKVSYLVTNSILNTKQTVSLNFKIVDTTPPEFTVTDTIILLAPNTLNIAAIAKVTDTVDGAIDPSKIKIEGTINSEVEGTYPVKLSVADTSGNSVTKSIKVIIVDNRAKTAFFEKIAGYWVYGSSYLYFYLIDDKYYIEKGSTGVSSNAQAGAADFINVQTDNVKASIRWYNNTSGTIINIDTATPNDDKMNVAVGSSNYNEYKFIRAAK